MDHFDDFTRVTEAEAEVFVVLFGEVEQDGAGLEDGEVVAVVVDDGGDAAIRIDFEERFRLLFVFGEVNGGRGVGDAEFFEEDANFLTVGRGGCEELDASGCHFGGNICKCRWVGELQMYCLVDFVYMFSPT